MIYHGHVKNGVIVPDVSVTLPDGLRVTIEIPEAESEKTRDDKSETLGQKLLKYAGRAEGLPADAARNHDHYLYGTPRR